MKTRLSCNCHDHELEFEWEAPDSYMTVAFWTRTRNWMGIFDRIKKAWQVFWWGSALIDDVYIARPEDAVAAARVLMNYAREQYANHKELTYTDEMQLRPLLESLVNPPAVPEPTANPAEALGAYLARGFTRKPLPKE